MKEEANGNVTLWLPAPDKSGKRTSVPGAAVKSVVPAVTTDKAGAPMAFFTKAVVATRLLLSSLFIVVYPIGQVPVVNVQGM